MKTIDNNHPFKSLAWMVVLLSVMLVSGCGGGGGGGSSSSTGTLSVYLTDAPACGFDQVNITITKVRVHQSSSASGTDAGWSDIVLNPARKINLLDLANGTIDKLGDISLPSGHYTQVRLVLQPNTTANNANTVIPSAGVETELVIPSGDIKVLNGFDVTSGQHTDLLFDFDACKSIVKRGNGTFSLKPVIKTSPFTLNGIKGYVDPALRGSFAMITAQMNGATVKATSLQATSGDFFLARIAPGNYDVVITANDHSTAIITSVPVTSETSIVTLNTSVNPITLPLSFIHVVSGTASLKPPIPSESAQVSAKQVFGTSTVTVKSVTADDAASGQYSLTLPIDAPRLVQYVTGTLPSFILQAGAAGKYTLDASATGYQSQSVNIDITSTDLTQSYILMP